MVGWCLLKIFGNNFLSLIPKFSYSVNNSWIKKLDSEFIIIYITVPFKENNFINRIAYAFYFFDGLGAKDDFDVLLSVKDYGAFYKNNDDKLLFFIVFVESLQNKAF